jgi:hypothetical protein
MTLSYFSYPVIPPQASMTLSYFSYPVIPPQASMTLSYFSYPVIPPQASMTLSYFSYPVSALGLSWSQRLLNYLTFKYFVFDGTRCRLSQKCVVRTNLDIYLSITCRGLWDMVFNATFNNLSIISRRSFLIGGGNRSTRSENHLFAASHWQTLYHIMLYRVHLAWAVFELTT